jgi:N-acetylglucosamine kinase-like BadF-type ATPase
MRGELEVTLLQLRKPRLVIHNVSKDTTVDNLEETITAQNPELDLEPREINARFIYTTKWGQTNTVIEVGPETRRKLPQKKLKIGWHFCKVTDYLVSMRCFKCSRFNHGHKD